MALSMHRVWGIRALAQSMHRVLECTCTHEYKRSHTWQWTGVASLLVHQHIRPPPPGRRVGRGRPLGGRQAERQLACQKGCAWVGVTLASASVIRWWNSSSHAHGHLILAQQHRQARGPVRAQARRGIGPSLLGYVRRMYGHEVQVRAGGSGGRLRPGPTASGGSIKRVCCHGGQVGAGGSGSRQ